MTVLGACDLDRTLVYSPAALLLDVPDEEAPRLLCVEVYGGRPLSFVTEEAAAGLTRLADRGLLLPVTTRTPAQYRRLRLPGPPPPYAVCANGGRLLVDGEEDPSYTAAVAGLLADRAPFTEMGEAVAKIADGAPWVAKVRSACDLFCYVVLTREPGDVEAAVPVPREWLEELAAEARARGWVLSLQERKLYLVPEGLTKWYGVAWVAERLEPERVLSAGDSLLDAPLLERADAGLVPAHGELVAAGFSRPHVQVTRARGVLAGEEITRWLEASAA